MFERKTRQCNLYLEMAWASHYIQIKSLHEFSFCGLNIHKTNLVAIHDITHVHVFIYHIKLHIGKALVSNLCSAYLCTCNHF